MCLPGLFFVLGGERGSFFFGGCVGSWCVLGWWHDGSVRGWVVVALRLELCNCLRKDFCYVGS